MVNSSPRATLVTICLGGALLLSGCGAKAESSPPADSRGVLRVSGSGSTADVLKRLAPTLKAVGTADDLRFLEGTDSSGGIAAVKEGVIELGAVSRAPKPGEKAAQLGYEAFALDAAAFVAPGSGVRSLSRGQLKRAFSGGVTNWRALGGTDLPITVLVRDEDESLTQLLRARLFGERFGFSPDAVVLTSAGDMNKALAKTPGAVGFTSYGSLVSTGAQRSVIAVAGRRPSVEALERDAYPFVRRLGVVFRKERQAARTTGLLGSSSVRRMLRKLGYAPA